VNKRRNVSACHATPHACTQTHHRPTFRPTHRLETVVYSNVHRIFSTGTLCSCWSAHHWMDCTGTKALGSQPSPANELARP
jgi:hypothetical protein